MTKHPAPEWLGCTIGPVIWSMSSTHYPDGSADYTCGCGSKVSRDRRNQARWFKRHGHNCRAQKRRAARGLL